MKKVLLPLLALLCCVSACKEKEDPVDPQEYKVGKNRFTISVDGNEREYYVHVPANYTETSPIPVVFMLHGTSGDGEKFYDGSGWKELGETENILTVFPSSGRNCIIDEGLTKNTTKWNVVPDAEFTYCPGEKTYDDIKFLRSVIAELRDKFNVDGKRIYLCGFSNGGQMAAKCAVEMSDVFAAIVEDAGSFVLDTTYSPKRLLPVMFLVGNEDYGAGNTGPTIPLSALDTLLSTPDLPQLGKFNRIATRHIRHFKLNPDFEITGDTTKAVVATYQPSTSAGHEFKFVFVSGLSHQYPNGTNHWLNGAKVQWEWMKNYTLP